MKTQDFEKEIKKQVNLNKIGIYEVFVNVGELREYWGLDGDKNSPIMQKVYVTVFDGDILSISFERSRAIRNLLDEACVDTLEELENL